MDIVRRFCTPQGAAEDDGGGISGAEAREIPFEGERLAVYSWGQGPNVLLAHGWGSRAGHMALLARILAQAGFRVTAYDAPAHGRSRKTASPNESNLFEYCRALSCVAKTVGPLHAVIGHSIGAAASALTLAGRGLMSSCRFEAERLVLISCPSGVARLIESFCKNAGEPGRTAELTEKLQSAFNFAVGDYAVTDVLGGLAPRIMIVHDEDDADIPVADALGMKEARADAGLFLTKGSGHQRILVNRSMFRAVKDFISA